ncbi:endo alpha-1,4 polygalactosaminidase [Flavobacterium sp. '19STA2R22 D10 B1']|uniref:endo alpha-1,4 polygalactosaminidase n=1 Tax=Flavobacterium aerium TaxID=3037261 RepID=UPI00278C0F94|nr:endo alpha-1,4 polygalactosaminidase [Flavobacterium sp. '19STA2R22 D10 B1']
MKTNSILFILLSLLSLGCSSSDGSKSDDEVVNYRQEMRDFVVGISTKAKSSNPNFIVIPQNGIELISNDDNANGSLNMNYLNAIDGHGQEDLWYGYDNDNQETPAATTNYINAFLNRSKTAGKTILVTDYCSTTSKVNQSYTANNALSYISFAAHRRELDAIPSFPTPIYHSNANVITKLSEAKNFLYLINTSSYSSKAAFISAVQTTNYDVLIMDLFFNDDAFTSTEITALKQKANGGKRLIICYMSIGEAENYRYYWQSSWNTHKPDWIQAENPDWEGNYKVKYWNTEWQGIIYRSNTSYLKKIMDAGYNGVYLDIIDAFEYFE